MADYVNPIDQLFDEENEEPITLYDDNDKPSQFDQIAMIPIEEKWYAILKPLFEVEGMEEDEALVFFIDEENDTLTVVNDDELGCAVFEEYYKLLDEIDGEE